MRNDPQNPSTKKQGQGTRQGQEGSTQQAGQRSGQQSGQQAGQKQETQRTPGRQGRDDESTRRQH